jgi:hypothetical protein
MVSGLEDNRASRRTASTHEGGAGPENQGERHGIGREHRNDRGLRERGDSDGRGSLVQDQIVCLEDYAEAREPR